jgi:hypothetical protein
VPSRNVNNVCFFFVTAECSSLKDVRIVVPTAVKRGETAILRCQYDIESDLLYTVKWYRSEMEFYRYTPKENPVMKVFSKSAFTVSVSKFTNTTKMKRALEE